MGKTYDLYNVETWHERHITTVSARSAEEARRKAWRKIAAVAPKLVPYLKENGILVIQRGDSGWGTANFGK